MEKNEKANPSAFRNHNPPIEKQKNSTSESHKPVNETNNSQKTSSNTEGKDLQKIRDLILAKKSTNPSDNKEKPNESIKIFLFKKFIFFI
jgi:hypothetical protein